MIRLAPAARASCAGLLLLLGLGGCASPAYYTQAVTGHFKLMGSREPVAAYLAQAPADDPTAQRLQTVEALLDFAADRLDLPANGSYESFSTLGDGPVTWNVVATPELSLAPKTWCFPVAGCVPYRGYFERGKAERFAEKMRRRDRDVAISGATAYSTLGWFRDPIPGALLGGDPTDLAATLIHELAHQRLYVKGDTPFNEAYASFLERQGLEAWLTAQGQLEALAAWEARQAAADSFIDLLLRTRNDLARLYASEESEPTLRAAKASRFAQLRQDYDALVLERWDGRDRFGAWFDPAPNNADLALVASYRGGACAFATLWRDSGEDFRQFHDAAEAIADRTDAARRAWLAQPCP